MGSFYHFENVKANGNVSVQGNPTCKVDNARRSRFLTFWLTEI